MLASTASRIRHFLYVVSRLIFYRLFKFPRTFSFKGKSYRYFFHPYNLTWVNERAVEVPLAMERLQQHHPGRVLEVGNVLSHYTRVTHDVVDKYERSPGVLNEDVTTYKPARTYDLIISISTLEHVGWDEEPREPEKLDRAVDNLTNLLAPGGELFVTLPLGQNSYLDDRPKNGPALFQQTRYMKRISRQNDWVEVAPAEVDNVRYNDPYPCGCAIVVGTIRQTSPTQ